MRGLYVYPIPLPRTLHRMFSGSSGVGRRLLALFLAADPVKRHAVDAWRPGEREPMVAGPPVDARNIVHAADLWFSIRQHGCVEGQRRLHEPRAA